MKEKSKQIKFDFPVYDKIDTSLTDITALYLRVSTDMQAQDGYGLDVQYSALYKYCTAYELSNPVVFIDDGYTGVNGNRPAFQKMLELMSKGKIKFVITYSLDRIGRTQMLILKFLKEDCERAKCDFLAVKDNVDSRSKQTYGILISILSIFAEFDHDAIVAKLTLGRKQRALEGYWKGGGLPPFGYKYSKTENNLIADPDKASLIQKIFDMYNTNEYSPRQIAEALGISSDVVVFGILRNRTYLGEITFRGEQYEGKHERLVDEESFNRAQELLQKRANKTGDSHYLLSSLVYCGNCNAKMRYMKWGKGKNQKTKIICYSKYPSTKKNLVKDPDCPNCIYDADEVEAQVIKTIMGFAYNYKDDINSRIVTEEDIVAGLQKKIDTLQIEYGRLLNAYRKLGDESVLEQASNVNEEIKRIERDIEEEKEKQTIAKKIEENENMLRTLPDMWPRMTNVERQAVIKSIVKKVILQDGEISVVLNKTQYEKNILVK
ncbi:MAG: recombinase family protein [Clostridia bacterium]|nr:recombinase family protein [Clostridia bacterium]